jgi:hypothetical protein
LWVIFALLVPDLDFESGSIYTDPIEFGSSPNPDPRHCRKPNLLFHLTLAIFVRSQEIETFGNVMELVSRNMAIDITLGDKEKKEIANNVKVVVYFKPSRLHCHTRIASNIHHFF